MKKLIALIAGMASALKSDIANSVTAKDVSRLLSIIDNKGLVAFAARRLKGTQKSEFESWIGRILAKGNAEPILLALKSQLPAVAAA